MHLNLTYLRPDFPLFFSVYVLRLKYLQVFVFRVHFVCCPLFALSFGRPNSICHESQITKLLIMQRFSIYCYYLPLGSKCYSENLFLNSLNGWLYHKAEIKFQRCEKQLVKCVFLHLNPCVFNNSLT